MFLLSFHSTSLLFYPLTTQEQELQVFSSTQGKALKNSVKELRWYLCLGVSSYQAPPATLHCSLIKPLPCSVTDQEDPALIFLPNPAPRDSAQARGVWILQTQCLRHSAEGDRLRDCTSALFSSGVGFLSTREHSNTTYRPGMGHWC